MNTIPSSIINIGACTSRKVYMLTGGIVVLFEAWIRFCDSRRVKSCVIDSNKGNYRNHFCACISILWQLVKKVRSYDIIMLHGSAKDYLYLAPIVVCMSRLCGKKIVLRKFAGNFEDIYNRSGRLRKIVYNYILGKSDIQYWETKSLVAFGDAKGRDSRWFPNARERGSGERLVGKPYTRRFVYLSRLEQQKGLAILTQCFASLPKGYHVDIYGPEIDYEISKLTGTNFTYKGAVAPCDVGKVLSQYDVLLLPTMWKTEGYPGIVIESYAAGLPVIASRIGGIPEIVENGHNGLLCEPGSVEALREAILSINQQNYHIYAKHARDSFSSFDAEVVHQKILSELFS